MPTHQGHAAELILREGFPTCGGARFEGHTLPPTLSLCEHRGYWPVSLSERSTCVRRPPGERRMTNEVRPSVDRRCVGEAIITIH